MHIFIRALLVLLGLALPISPLLAFDNDAEISQIDLSQENFLDIKAHRFRKSLEYQWFDNTTAWRITGASLNSDLTFLQTQLKLQHALSEYVNVRLEVEQEVFYADKEFPLPTVEVEYYPWAGDLGFSLLGTPTYEKSNVDLGLAVIWGRRNWNYTRFEYVEVDSLYNQKNVSDNSFYSEESKALKLEGAYQFGAGYKLRFSISRDTPLELIDPDNNAIFNHQASDYFLLFDYELLKGMGKQYELRVGSQYDYITNDTRDLVTSSNNLDYSMATLQVYTTAYHPFNEHMAWDLGLYIGQVEEQQNFLQDSSKDSLNDSVEAKFRMGFEYSSTDGRSSIQFNLSLNLDDLIDHPTDGGGISFQSVF